MTRLNVLREGQRPLRRAEPCAGLRPSHVGRRGRELAQAHTVLRYDHRNHGQSEQVPGPLTMQMLAEDAAELIRREADEPVHFVGLSMGGMTAQALAPPNPRACCAAWSSPILPPTTPTPRPGAARVETVQAQGIGAIAPGAVARWLTPGFVATPEGAAAARQLQTRWCAPIRSATRRLAKRWARIDFRAKQPRTSPCRRWSSPARTTRPRRLRCPKRWCRPIPNARLASIDAAHLSAVERPAEFVAAADRLLAQPLRPLPRRNGVLRRRRRGLRRARIMESERITQETA